MGIDSQPKKQFEFGPKRFGFDKINWFQIKKTYEIKKKYMSALLTGYISGVKTTRKESQLCIRVLYVQYELHRGLSFYEVVCVFSNFPRHTPGLWVKVELDCW